MQKSELKASSKAMTSQGIAINQAPVLQDSAGIARGTPPELRAMPWYPLTPFTMTMGLQRNQIKHHNEELARYQKQLDLVTKRLEEQKKMLEHLNDQNEVLFQRVTHQEEQLTRLLNAENPVIAISSDDNNLKQTLAEFGPDANADVAFSDDINANQASELGLSRPESTEINLPEAVRVELINHEAWKFVHEELLMYFKRKLESEQFAILEELTRKEEVLKQDALLETGHAKLTELKARLFGSEHKEEFALFDALGTALSNQDFAEIERVLAEIEEMEKTLESEFCFVNY